MLRDASPVIFTVPENGAIQIFDNSTLCSVVELADTADASGALLNTIGFGVPKLDWLNWT